MRPGPRIALLLAVLAALLVVLIVAQGGPGTAPPAATVAARERSAPAPPVAEAAAPASDEPARAMIETPVALPGDEAGRPTTAAARDETSLVIAVRTEEGEPVAGVPVGIEVTRAGHTRLAWRGDTEGPGGTARVDGIRSVIEGSGPPPPAAVFAFPCAGARAVPIDPANLPAEPVVLVVPATGQVEVLLDGDGAETANVRVELASAGAQSLSAQAERGRAHFPFVGLGLQLEVTAARAGQSQHTRVLSAGPSAGGETVVVHLSLAEPDWCIVVLHVQDDAGAPCRDARLDVQLDARAEGSHSSSTTSATTDGDGTLRWVVDDDLGDAARRTLSLRTAAGDVQLAHLLLPQLRRGDNDLGVVQLQRPALVCSGVVVDAGGAPVAGASVRVQSRTAAHGEAGWSDQHGLEAETDQHGAFAVRGVPQAPELGVAAAAQGFLPLDPQPFAVGATGLRLVLERAATLAGSVLLRDGLEPGDVVVDLQRDPSSKPLTERPAPNGEFAFARLAPGVVAVRVHTVGALRGGLIADGVVVRAGETTRDPRLQQVDLLHGVQRIAFTIVDSGGARVRDAEALVDEGGPAQDAFEGILLPQGEGHLFAPGPSVDLLVHAPDHRWTRVAGVVDGQQVVLLRAAVVRLRLAPGLAGAGRGLQVRLQRLDPTGASEGRYTAYHGTTGTRRSSGTLPWAGSCVGEVGAGGEAVLMVESPGRYSCTWSLGRHGNVVPCSLTEVRIDERDTEFVLDAGITAAALAAARK